MNVSCGECAHPCWSTLTDTHCVRVAVERQWLPSWSADHRNADCHLFAARHAVVCCCNCSFYQPHPQPHSWIRMRCARRETKISRCSVSLEALCHRCKLNCYRDYRIHWGDVCWLMAVRVTLTPCVVFALTVNRELLAFWSLWWLVFQHLWQTC